ncbi:MAG: hypothetical protein A2653_00475 [Candidatus Zambryskibacteria bacterium RIFCSPHIGHO2_01_FULL_43_25]|uniref:DUF5667 domain-containing protein n=1 Tax=Candidatus Zambryskibacteria bacterium RIFCSPLOWO2_01_FULL_45_21 TaxID=1802761 RepID=A0A1G2U388_9BACT|nr:MAG: hypothetical protein A2653_00475 [Candidatus Zambryskibacteria bacterium RIFCSPHIGHO2_01_FULL_43_25]OHB00882.1 MAG: hypothetical protein A3E94_01350 [Candidatus Zambryskibacteria bacterium RIFCSPHIGHO2_12_FULL_44_12b]OHB03340.1 MAG: hypothetical protein A3B14_00310 [Candidatus Zambryskibacteria bacterium RIFCSPLOWO2_01_FULL_45_21]
MKKTFEQLIDEAKSVSLSVAEKETLKRNIFEQIQSSSKPLKISETFNFLIFTRTHLAASALVLLFVLVGATSAFAERALPGGLLYPLKTGVNEEVRGWFAFSGQAEAEFEIDLAHRRLEEIEKMTDSSSLTDEKKNKAEEQFVLHTEKAERSILSGSSEGEKEGKGDDSASLTAAEQESPARSEFSLKVSQEAAQSDVVSKESAEELLKDVKSKIELLGKILKSKKQVPGESRIEARLFLLKAERMFVDGKVKFSEKDYGSAAVELTKALQAIENILQSPDLNLRTIFEMKLKAESDSSDEKNPSDDFTQIKSGDSFVDVKLRSDGTIDDDQSGSDTEASGEVRGANSQVEFEGDEPKQEDRRNDRGEDGDEDKNRIEIRGEVQIGI